MMVGDGFPEGIEREKSCGALVIRDKKMLFTKNRKHQVWGIPKGHIHEGESDLECARREIAEEVNLHNIRLVDDFKRSVTYHNEKFNTIKTVVLFIFLSDDGDVEHVDEEIDEHKWCDVDEARSIIGDINARDIIFEAVEFAKERGLL